MNYKAWCNSLKCVGVYAGKKAEKPFTKHSANCPDCGSILEIRKTKSRYHGKKKRCTLDEFDVDVFKTAL